VVVGEHDRRGPVTHADLGEDAADVPSTGSSQLTRHPSGVGPGALPLMEYALTELFERRDGRVLSLDAYREIGGVSGALGRRAEELFAELNDDGKEAAHQLFLRLVALGGGTEDTRRRVFRSEVSSLDVNQQAMAAVIDPFGASRQLSFDRDTKTVLGTRIRSDAGIERHHAAESKCRQ
jgi:Novel STAND NTPase 1